MVSILDLTYFPLRSKAASFTCVIAEFQRDTSQIKYLCIKPSLQILVKSFASPSFLKPILPKYQTRVGNLLPSYNIGWLIRTDSYSKTIIHFQKLTSQMSPLTIDLAIQNSIFSVVISSVNAAMASVQIKYKEEMLVLWEMIKKSLFFKKSISSTLLLTQTSLLRLSFK